MEGTTNCLQVHFKPETKSKDPIRAVQCGQMSFPFCQSACQADSDYLILQ